MDGINAPDFWERTNTNNAESELIYSIRAPDPAKELFPTSTLWIRRTKECMDLNPVIHGRVSDHNQCGEWGRVITFLTKCSQFGC